MYVPTHAATRTTVFTGRHKEQDEQFKPFQATGRIPSHVGLGLSNHKHFSENFRLLDGEGVRLSTRRRWTQNEGAVILVSQIQLGNY